MTAPARAKSRRKVDRTARFYAASWNLEELRAPGRETAPLARPALREEARPPLSFFPPRASRPTNPRSCPKETPHPRASIMNGTLDCLQDHTLNEEQGAFMFTSESVGEGHPGKALLEVLRSRGIRGMSEVSFPTSRSPPWRFFFGRRFSTTLESF